MELKGLDEPTSLHLNFNQVDLIYCMFLCAVDRPFWLSGDARVGDCVSIRVAEAFLHKMPVEMFNGDRPEVASMS